MKRTDTEHPCTVLITRFSAIGDVAMTIPVVYSVCRSNPDVRFVMVTRPSMATMMVNAPENLTVHASDVSNDYKGVRGMKRLFRELRDRYAFDAYADLHNVLRTRILRLFCRLKGIPATALNKERGHRRALTRRANKVMLPMTTQRARYRDVFLRLGLALEDRFTSLFPPEGAPAESFAEITEPKQAGEVWIGVAPFAAHPGKVYPPELMEQVVARLAGEGRRIFLFGGGGREQEIMAKWVEKYPGLTSLAGKKYGFPKELALISHLDTMISMDSANMHLASLVGVPVVSIWGATHPYCGFRGFHQREVDTVQLALTCRPCSVFGDKACHRGDLHCLRGIAPATVAAKAEAVIKRKTDRHGGI